ncbi:MAG: CDP-alcohol phosphatidyltransferase family protein [Lachnospiraceae bacterium]|nr:CDP-alcohol phosphatidyltransferase family protein [Lachnospiraceae bacterium]
MKEYFTRKQILTIPNLLTLVRLVLVPFIIYYYIAKEYYLLTVILLALSGISDVADGIIARKFNQVSDLGKMIDPVADKLTQIAVLFCLVWRFPLMWVPLALLTVKEIYNAICGLVVIKKTGRVYGADWHGKVATVFLYSTMVLHILWDIIAGQRIPELLSQILIWVSVALMVLTLILYSIQNFTLIRNAGKQEES